MRQSNVKDFHSQLYIKDKVYSYMGNGSAVYLIIWVFNNNYFSKQTLCLSTSKHTFLVTMLDSRV